MILSLFAFNSCETNLPDENQNKVDPFEHKIDSILSLMTLEEKWISYLIALLMIAGPVTTHAISSASFRIGLPMKDPIRDDLGEVDQSQ